VKRALVFLALFLSAGVAGCKSSEGGPAEEAKVGEKPKHATETTAKVTALAIHNDNLNVDQISMKDGNVHGDGNRDHVFTATVEGPLEALFLVTTDEKGAPIHGFRADTVTGHTELPQELAAAGQIDVGRMTVWIAVVENNKFINTESGGVSLPAGPHSLKLYVPNTGTLRPNSHLRLYGRAPNGAIVGGPTVPY
jgi:hypothetical protein